MSDIQEIDFLILGAGPTGLGAAHQLNELGEDNYLVLESSGWPGGLAASYVDEAGFTWDVGGHVQFSLFPEYHALLHRLLPPDQWLTHQRSAWIWMLGRFIPYPLQQSLDSLPPHLAEACRSDLPHTPDTDDALHFSSWLKAQFGHSLNQLFMRPYNEKIWAHPLENMSYQWIAQRIAPPSAKMQSGWGANQHFIYPASGGTGAIWKALADSLPQNRILYHHRAARIDARTKIVTCDNGKTIRYRRLISTLPLSLLPEMLHDEIIAPARGLTHSSTHVVGLGLRGSCPELLRSKSWIYFPENNCPFYRATVLSGYSPAHTPPGDFWSLMTESSASPHRPQDAATIAARTIEGALATGLIQNRSDIVSTWHYHAPFGYPTPTLNRDDILRRVIPTLEAMDIYSRGRFGGWKYEFSNQDHCFMQGTQLIMRLLRGEPETVYMP